MGAEADPTAAAPYTPAGFTAAGAGGAMPAGMPALDNPASVASRVPNAPNVEAGIRAMGGLPTLYDTSGANAYKVPGWTQQLAKDFGLTASTYASGGSLHQMGYAFDFNGPQPNMDAFADFIQNNLSPQTLQLIHASGQRRWGIASGHDVSGSSYYAGDYGGHFDHVHWATDVPPIMNDQPAGVDDSIVGASSNQFRTAGFHNVGDVVGPAGPTVIGDVPNINPVAGQPHYSGPTLPGPPTSHVSSGEHVATPQPNMRQSSVSDAASGMWSVLGSLGSDMNPRAWQGILHEPAQQGMQHSGGIATTVQSVNYDHSITINNPTVANADALTQAMRQEQLSRFYTVTGGLPMSGVGSP